MKRKTTFLLCALAMTSAGFAQQQGGWGGPPPQQGGFPGGGGPPMGQMMRHRGGPVLLMSPDVQKELKLTEAQKSKIGELLADEPMGMPGGPPPRAGVGGPPPPGGGVGGPPPQGGPGGPPPGGGVGGPPPRPGQGGFGGPPRRGPNGDPQMDQERNRMESKIKAILSADQYTRYQELGLQQRGAVALGDPRVAAKVGLSDDQVDNIHQIVLSNLPAPPARGNGGPPDMDQMHKQMEDNKAMVEGKILATLTNDQKAAWHKLLGKPFMFRREGEPAEGRRGN